MASIKIPTPLRTFTGGNAEIAVNGPTVGAVLADLTTQFPELREQLYNGDELRNFVNIFIGDEDIRYQDGLETEVSADAKLRIIPSIAGGVV
jgi:molybdopterin converting factor small subunit